MKPRMNEKGIPGKPENEFSIRNPWIPLTPGKPIPSTSNGISVERNENQLGSKNWYQFFELLDRSSKQMPGSNRNGSNCYSDEPLNQSNGSYSVAEHRMRDGISQSRNNFDLTASINQNSSSNGTGNHIGNRIMQGRNNHNLNKALSRSSGSYSMADHQMGNGILRGGNNFNLAGRANQISSSNSTDNYIQNGIIQGDNNYDFTGQLNQVGSSNTTVDPQMRDGISQAGNNYNPGGQMNQVSRSNGTRNCIGNGIVQGGNNYKFSAQLNQVSNSNTRGHQMRNGILQGGYNHNPSGQTNQISSSNGTHCHIGKGIFQGVDNYNFTGQLHQVCNSSTAKNHQMRNGILQGGNSYNSTAQMNQISSSNGTGNHIGNGIIQGGNNHNFTDTLNQISSSNTMCDHQMGHRILQGGDNCNITGQMNWTNSSNSTGDHILHEIMRNGNNSNFRGLLNQITNSNSVIDHQMGNEDIHNYPKSETQKFCSHIPSLSNSSMALNRRLIGNMVQQKTNMSSVTIPRENSVISSPILNLNRQPLSSTRVMNSPNSLIPNLNSYSEVDNSWTEGNFTSLLLGDEIADLGSNNNFLTQKSLQMPTDGFHVPAPDNNLYTPAKRGSDARTRNINSFPFAPITPEQTNNLEKDRQNEMLKLFVENGSFQEHNKVVNLLSPIENEAIENRCSQLLQTIVGTSSNVVTPPQTENKIIDEKSDHDVIDLNETPKQKTPKRRKHRPKVIREGKPKKTPKTKTPKNEESEKNPSNKRKYVQKNRDPDVENATHQQTDAINIVKIRNKEESCKKRLNFDFEKAEMPRHQGSQPVLDLNLNYPGNQMESHAPTAPSEIINCNTSIVIAKHKKLQGELNKNISQVNVNLERSNVVRWRSTHQMVERDVGSFKGFCGSEGEDSHPVQPENQETISPKVRNSSEDTHKKQKTKNDFQTILCGPEKEQFFNGTCDESTTNTENDMQRELIILNQQMARERMRKRISCRSSQVQFKPESAATSKHADSSGYQQRSEKDVANMQNNGLKISPNPCRVISFCSNVVPLQESKEISHSYQQPSMKARGRPKAVKYSKNMVEEITSRLQHLTISGENGGKDGKQVYALVPYEGGGAIITYEAKKRVPRPKVDLDPETARLWKLLMGKEGSEASEGENKDKEKWWEEERRVFHGRAESFIARMHLVQGDRRFSPWKGSVVDSIIGVFLTQNVSDQLSSSAFMALAAQFPLSSTTPDQTSDHSGTSNLTEESEIYLGSLGTEILGLETEPSKTTKVDASSPRNSSDSSVHNVNGEIQSFSGSSSETEDTNNWGKIIKNNGFTSVQNANRTAPLQVLKNPENEHVIQKQGSDQFSNLNSVFSLNHPIDSHMQNSIMPPNYFQMLMASQVARSGFNYYEISREECKSSAPEITKDKTIGYWDNWVNHATTETETVSNTLFQQNMQNNKVQNMDPFRKDQHSFNTHQLQRPQTYESEQIRFSNPSRPNESVITRNSAGQRTTADNKQVSIGERPNDGQAKGQSCSSEINAKISAKTLNTSHNGEKEKKESFDWDSLRKMVYSKNGGEKERSVDSSDSMDYEAMRCSDVNVISNSIRMRGMNHMLAERIKDFLNRVVTDHGSIDLEWLRDVPPDKSKDYLLSIRGLGLKSVECVRLLTLHHLAFPVDTNVGRIAVRLGWVPLQPLPESLQLHLLEMYPVLETVQKYLWPRLCKLDQKTLYELHYQLITFGKVFCTKSKPNCNACPMRGECRHFASAFASARLALPAPEDKGIVNSTTPITTGRRADLANRPMLLQLPSGSSNKERELIVNGSEPIIEEPTTPEPDITEITETDIEDAFYEDPDEIPSIRLNVEQLAANLRYFMEEHTDLQEGDMSKALVALTPEVASIPVPKLKYVLRLRTERQVYVLTDTHPLVKGLDKREPDDPSPYLFALLAPGEEASLGQSSGKKCESKGSEELCNEKDCCPVEGEANSQTVRGTLLIPCRTATRGSFPLNGTYFQVNEVFADHESGLTPIDVPRKWLWHLETRTVFFGTSATSIFRGMTTKEIQNSFWRGFVCVRGFDRKSRAPRPLNRNLHLAQSKTVKTGNEAL